MAAATQHPKLRRSTGRRQRIPGYHAQLERILERLPHRSALRLHLRATGFLRHSRDHRIHLRQQSFLRPDLARQHSGQLARLGQQVLLLGILALVQDFSVCHCVRVVRRHIVQ